jgi:ATP-dependent RNA helicase RhlE
VRSLATGAEGLPLTSPNFADLGVAEPLLRALAADSYSIPTPIQAKAIPPLLAGSDLLGIAETGTGKTAAFALPILQKLAAKPDKPMPKSPRALILAPTRELALQIFESFRSYGRHLKLTPAVIFGGVGQGAQVQALVRGVDILVATPGRLLDLAGQGYLRLHRVEHLVLDEADRMLDMGFVRDVRKIVAMAPKERQSLLFSATMPEDIAKLAAEMLRAPVRIEIARAGKTVDRIAQSVHFVDSAAKRHLLTDLLADPALARVMVFTRTKHGANRVSQQLDRAGIASEAIHGNKSQNARQRALAAFKSGETRVLVATDIAARGLDIDEVSHVINYELPNEPEAYVHRIGRTARAGADGIAIAFCAPDERAYLRDIERLIRKQLTAVGAPPARSVDAAERTEPREKRRPDRRGEQRRGAGGREQPERRGDRSERREKSETAVRARANGNGRHEHAGNRQRERVPQGGAGPTPWSNWTSHSDRKGAIQSEPARRAPLEATDEGPRQGQRRSRRRRRGRGNGTEASRAA